MVCFIIPGITPTLHGFTQAYSHFTMHSNSFLNRQTTAHTYTKKEPPVNGSCLNRNLYAGKYLSWTLTFFLWMEAIYSHYLGFLLTWFEIWSKSTLSTIKPLFAAPDLNFDDDINDLFCKPFWRIRDCMVNSVWILWFRGENKNDKFMKTITFHIQPQKDFW